MGNYYAPFSVRISEVLLEKIKIVAQKNKRSANKEIEFALEEYIDEYENKHGIIEFERDAGGKQKTNMGT